MKPTTQKKWHSLSIRLVVLFLIMAVLFVLLVGGSLRLVFRHNFQEDIRPHLIQYMGYIQKDIGSPPDFEKAKQITEKLPVEIHLYSPEKQWSSTNTPLDLNRIKIQHQHTDNGVEYKFGKLEGHNYLIKEYENYTLAFSILHSNSSWSWLKVIPLALSLILLTILYYATRRIIHPVKIINDGIKKIGEGDLQYRVQVNQQNEFGDLSNSINNMAQEIQQMLEAKRHLLLAISHELRSPITRAKVSIELLNDAKKREEINSDLTEMDTLIAELLETERLSSRHSVLNRTNISLTGLARELVSEYLKKQNVSLGFSGIEIEANLDATRIKLMLKNLLDNALRFSVEDAQPPELSLTKMGEDIILTVQDFGKGIEEEHIPFLMEPFYRVDPARQRQTGGYGLGLYLCRMIAEAHGGKINISSENQKGTRVLVTLPAQTEDGK